MIKMIHNVTGVEMWVPEKEYEAFLKRGHKVVPPPKKPRKKPVKK